MFDNLPKNTTSYDDKLQLLEQWRDNVWQAALLAHNNGDVDTSRELGYLASALNHVFRLFHGEDVSKVTPKPVFGYEHYKFGDMPTQ